MDDGLTAFLIILVCLACFASAYGAFLLARYMYYRYTLQNYPPLLLSTRSRRAYQPDVPDSHYGNQMLDSDDEPA
eukprot:1353237-Amorphochlora_amoeboformis.AAC.2